MKYHLTPAVLANIKKLGNIHHWKVCGKTSFFINFGKNVN